MGPGLENAQLAGSKLRPLVCRFGHRRETHTTQGRRAAIHLLISARLWVIALLLGCLMWGIFGDEYSTPSVLTLTIEEKSGGSWTVS